MRTATVTLALVFVFAVVGDSGADNWSRWRGPEGTGISKEAGWNPKALSKLKVKWKTEVGNGHSACAVTEKFIYTMGNVDGKDIVYCLDAETGKEIWRKSYRAEPGNYDGPRATPVLDGKNLYTLSRHGDAYCFEASTGKEIWKKNLLQEFQGKNITWGLAGSPLVIGNSVYYNVCTYGVALDKATGGKLWASPGGKCGYSTPVLFNLKGKDCLALFSQLHLVIVDPKSGKKLLSFPWQTKHDVNASDPLFFDNKMLITSAYGRGCALLDLSGGSIRKLWENTDLCGHFTSPIYWKGFVYGIDGNTGRGKLKCLDPRTGKIKWSEGEKVEGVTLADGKLIVMDAQGMLAIAEASPNGFSPISKAEVLTKRAKNWTSPYIANGCIYCRDSKGLLVCVDVK